MTEKHKLSFGAAILININIMIGAGIFINTVELVKRAGAFGPAIYLIVGILMLPLIISIAKLVNLYPDGGFYTFGQSLNPFVGFFSAWSYFTGKLASATIMIHASVALIQQILPALQIINPCILDTLILTFFIILNMHNMKTGSTIQAIFLILKIIPISFAILSGLLLFQSANFTLNNVIFPGIIPSIPLVLFAFLGFEATCSLSSKIENAEYNGPRAIIISYTIVIILSFLFQLIFYASLGNKLAQQASYLQAFPLLLQTLLPHNPTFCLYASKLLHLAIASSALGGSYGILYSNNWNLYTLAKNNHIFFTNYFTALNRHFIPYACLIVEAFICIFYLFVTFGNQIPLQQIGALGCTISYTLSVLSLLSTKIKKNSLPISRWIPALGAFNCILLLGACIQGFLTSGIYALFAFSCLLAIGIIMFISTSSWRTHMF